MLRLRRRMRGMRASSLFGQHTVTVVEDDFNDSAIDYDTWNEEQGVSGYPGTAYIRETGGRLEVESTQVGWMKGLQLNDPIELNNAVISLDLEQSNYNIACISIIPDGSPFIVLPDQPDGYTYRVWSSDASPPIGIYRNGIRVFQKEWVNPVHLEIRILGGEIIFLEDGVEIYREAYQISSTFARIVLWGQSSYYNVGGFSWFDNFSVMRYDPLLGLTVDKTSAYIEDPLTFSGTYVDGWDTPIPGAEVTLYKKDAYAVPGVYAMPDPVQFPYTTMECYTGKDGQISPCAEIWLYDTGVMIDVPVYASPAIGSTAQEWLFLTLQACKDRLDELYPPPPPMNVGTALTDAGGQYSLEWTADEKGEVEFYTEAPI